jgi:hypothetical protein
MAAPSEDAAQHDIDNITQVMRDRIREAYREHHDMVEASRRSEQRGSNAASLPSSLSFSTIEVPILPLLCAGRVGPEPARRRSPGLAGDRPSLEGTCG